MKRIFAAVFFLIPVLGSCDFSGVDEPFVDSEPVLLDDVARMLSCLPVGEEQMREVHDAVCASVSNGYDEEYMMKDLFADPGAGVGDAQSTRASAASSYSLPMRSLIEDYLTGQASTKGSSPAEDADRYISALCSSSTQIYWPFSEDWDGSSLPVVTFDPKSNATVNVGYEIVCGPDGERSVREVSVDEQMARERPVWVVNTNDDSAYTSLELLRRADPDWGGGGSVVVKSSAEGDVRSLVLKTFRANRNFDSWFGGASEFFVKCGSVDGFTASTEAEMKLYSPTVTDFMIVVKRKQIGEDVPFNAILISDWTSQLENFAFLVTEDDGGTRTSWDFEATVKVQSKSYGITLEIPYNEKDDIVWRGSLSSRYLEKYLGSAQHFGDVDITFDVLE